LVVLPEDVSWLCRQEGIRPADVQEYRVGVRVPRTDLVGRGYWVRPVEVLTVAGRRYVFEVVDLNEEG